MKIKLTSILGLIAILAVSPILVSAQPDDKTQTKKIAVVEEKVSEEKNNTKQEVKDLKDSRGSSSTDATSSKEKKDKQEESRLKIFRLTAGLQKTIAREINQVKNIIARLTGAGSIIAKLETAGVNTTAIKAKLAEASVLADKAQTELTAARTAYASTTASTATTSIQTAKVKITEIRKQLAQAHTDIKAATKKIQEARKLINQIPGRREIEGQRATGTPKTGSTAIPTVEN